LFLFQFQKRKKKKRKKEKALPLSTKNKSEYLKSGIRKREKWEEDVVLRFLVRESMSGFLSAISN
jgi:hypothetical protein